MVDSVSRASRPKWLPRVGVATRGRGRWFAPALVLVAASLVARVLPGRGAMLVPEALRESVVSGAVWPRTLIDPLGREFTMRAPPTRIVSLVLGADEVLLDLVPPERLLGCTLYVDDAFSSPVAGRFPSSVPRLSSEIERVLVTQPDLVVVAGYTSTEFVLNLLDIGLPTLRFHRYHQLADVERLIDTLGRATGEDARAASLLSSFRARLDHVDRAVAGRRRPRVLVYHQGGYSVGTGTMLDELIERAGGDNVVRSLNVSGHVRLGDEAILASDPDIVVVTIGKLAGERDARSLLSPGLSTLRAVQRGTVVGVPAAWLNSVSHHAAKGLEALAEAFHPDAFADEGRSSTDRREDTP